MFETIPVHPVTVLSSLAVSLAVMAGGVLAFKLLWMNGYDFYFPKGNPDSARALSD